MEHFTILEPINCGRYGGVYKAHNRLKHIVAIKKMPFIRHDVNHFENIAMIQRESTNWKKVTGRNNILTLKEFVTNTEEAWFVSEYCSKGSLENLITTFYHNEADIKYTLKQILTGINNCHKEHIAHCDIKPANILLDDNNEWKLCDFGCSQETHSENTGLFIKRGTPLFIAPELYGFDGYGKNVDIWAIGILAYMMVHNGNHPFPWDVNFKQHIIDGKFTWNNTNISKEFKDFVQLCLNPNKQTRLSSDEILEHIYVKN